MAAAIRASLVVLLSMVRARGGVVVAIRLPIVVMPMVLLMFMFFGGGGDHRDSGGGRLGISPMHLGTLQTVHPVVTTALVLSLPSSCTANHTHERWVEPSSGSCLHQPCHSSWEEVGGVERVSQLL